MAINHIDYSKPENWLSLPTPTYDVDVLYLYPSACMDPESDVICAIDDPSMRMGAQSFLAKEMEVFEGTANVFAPYWRQVNGVKLPMLSFEEIDNLEHEEPETDVFDALDYYFTNLNSGRPFFLAGNSQGSRLMSFVLSNYMKEHPEVYDRMIAAYMLGDSLTKDFLAENPHVKAAQGAEDLGVVISYNTEGPENVDAKSLVVAEGAVAINPLNWKTDDTYASIDQNKGSKVYDFMTGELLTTDPVADAQLNIERGVVVVNTPESKQFAMLPDFAPLFGPASFHGQDYGFFYANLKQNVADRAAAWFKTH